MKPKIIANYLPQYHRVRENDDWWGEGFTEWTNVKKAKPFYKGQIQPRVPLNHNYYDLMDKGTIQWQTDLARKYGLYGFCYFHYWFKDGKKILERPAENLLKWKDINQRFCFFWANIEWRRTWKNCEAKATFWTPDDDKDEVLMEQDYGDINQWKNHFYYLLPFFSDERYIRIDNKPVFAIYDLDLIDCAEEMFRVWNEEARINGLEGLYIISVNQGTYGNPYINAIMHYAGGMRNMSAAYKIEGHCRAVINKLCSCCTGKKLLGNVVDYRRYCRHVLSDRPYGGVPNIPGGTVRFDSTPRQGKDALCLKNANPHYFESFLKKQIKRGQRVYGTEYLFLDAWNEWGEGNYLEPDEIDGYGYLEALKRAIDSFED